MREKRIRLASRRSLVDVTSDDDNYELETGIFGELEQVDFSVQCGLSGPVYSRRCRTQDRCRTFRYNKFPLKLPYNEFKLPTF